MIPSFVYSYNQNSAMRYTSLFIAVFLTTTTAFVGALPPSGLQSRDDDLDPSLFTLSENDLNLATNLDGDSSGSDFSSSLIALNPDDANAPLFDDLGSSSQLPVDDLILADSQASSCSGPASKKRDVSDEDLLLLCKNAHPS